MELNGINIFVGRCIVIIFDIDDTITHETEFMKKYAPRFLKRKYHCTFQIVNEYGYNVSEVFGIKKFLIKNNFPEDQIELELRNINSSFWIHYFFMYMFYPIKTDTRKIINNLKKRGYKIVFISTRDKKMCENETKLQNIVRKNIVLFLTKLQLKRNGIKYDTLILVQSNKEKVSYAKENNAKYIFDDNIEVINSLKYEMNAICIEAAHNININNSIIRIPFTYDSVTKLLEESIHKHSKMKIKDLSPHQRIYTEFLYKLLRTIGKNKVIRTYRPVILGKENIPTKKGSYVFVGNHRKSADILVTIAILKNPIHFAALKRLFEYKDNIWGGTVGKNVGTISTALLAKAIGALPIARATDNDYMLTNLQTFKYIDDYLKAKSSVMIYPEGTLNRKPEEDGNILQIKSLRAFRIAEKGNAVVYPIAITWIPEELKTENKVIISFLEPIYTNGLTSKEIADIWIHNMNNALDAMNRMFL